MEEKMLTFELSPDKEILEIHCDKQGLEDLIYYLQKLLNSKSEPPRHDHLMTPSWSGYELSEEKKIADNKLLNKVTIYLWN